MNAPDPNLLRPDGTFGSYRGKLVATCFSLGLVGAVLWPVQENWRAKPHDSFPLSYYPMFSAKRQAIETFYYMVGRDAEGKRYLIPHSMAGHGGLNAVRRQIAKICREGRGEELACTVAKRLAERERGRWSRIVSVAIVTGRYVVEDYFHGKKEPVSEKIRGTCTVERGPK
jgi:hypothetical protein